MNGYILAACMASFFCGWFFGWGAAHGEVARECERLGGFYVGNKVFECRRVSPKHNNPTAGAVPASES